MAKSMAPTLRKKKGNTLRTVGKSITLDVPLVAAINAQARSDERSFSRTVNRLLRRALELPPT